MFGLGMALKDLIIHTGNEIFHNDMQYVDKLQTEVDKCGIT